VNGAGGASHVAVDVAGQARKWGKGAWGKGACVPPAVNRGSGLRGEWPCRLGGRAEDVETWTAGGDDVRAWPGGGRCFSRRGPEIVREARPRAACRGRQDVDGGLCQKGRGCPRGAATGGAGNGGAAFACETSKAMIVSPS